MEQICNSCGKQKKMIPAGVSKKTGKSYKAFYVCENKCGQEKKSYKKQDGALWIRKSAKGEVYLSGQVEHNGETIKLSVFKNNHKEKENHPDYNILVRLEVPPKNEIKPEQYPF